MLAKTQIQAPFSPDNLDQRVATMFGFSDKHPLEKAFQSKSKGNVVSLKEKMFKELQKASAVMVLC